MLRLSALAFALLALLATPAAALEITAQRLKVSGTGPDPAAGAPHLMLRRNAATSIIVKRSGKALSATHAMPNRRKSLPPDALPDTEITAGDRNIRRAWLIRPTGRYGHGVLGDAVEAGGIAAELDDGSTVTMGLDEDSVFEDRRARLADMDGDGLDEILVVRAFLDAGAALTVVTAKGGKLRIAAGAEPIGMANRWLNPVGAADFDGDGRMEAAVVITPHIGGTLQLYEWKGDKLVEDIAEYGFSNHAMGARELGLSAIADLNGDGIPDMVLPNAGRGHLIGLTFAGGTFKELFRHRLEGRLVTNIAAGHLTGGKLPDIAYGTSDGPLTVLSITP